MISLIMKMKSIIYSTLVYFLTIAFGVNEINAQSFYRSRQNRTWTFSYGLGWSTYHGDLHDFLFDGVSSSLGANAGIGLRKRFTNQLSISLDINYYTIAGDDAANGSLNGRTDEQRRGERSGERDTRFVRNLSFFARNWEVTTNFIFDLIPENRGFTRRPITNVYIKVGVGFSTNNPKARHPDLGKVNLRHLNTEALPDKGYSGFLLVVPVGIGLKFRANKFIDIVAEGARRFTFSDYLDDVSTVYPSRDALQQSDRIGAIDDALVIFDRSAEGGFPARRPGNTRGNPDKNDAYYVFQLRLEMYLEYGWFDKLFKGRRRRPKFR